MTEVNTINGIEVARKRKKIKASDLASQLNVDVNIVHSWESDEGKILLNQLERIKKILDTSYEMLLYREERKGLRILHLTEEQQKYIISLHELLRISSKSDEEERKFQLSKMNIFSTSSNKTKDKDENIAIERNVITENKKNAENKIGSKILFLRNNFLNMNQSRFARKFGVSRQTLISWEDNQMKPNIYNVKLICRYCGVTTDYLLDEECPFELCARGLSEDGYDMLESLINFFENENKMVK